MFIGDRVLLTDTGRKDFLVDTHKPDLSMGNMFEAHDQRPR